MAVVGCYFCNRFEAWAVPNCLQSFRPLLRDKSLDGMFLAMTISLPTVTELLNIIPKGDPLLIYYIIQAARDSMTR